MFFVHTAALLTKKKKLKNGHMDRVEALSAVVKKHVNLLKEFNIFIFEGEKYTGRLLSKGHSQLTNKSFFV